MTEHKRHVYLNMLDLESARELFMTEARPKAAVAEEKVPVEEALGRVTAGPVWALDSSPRHHLAAMDGIALKAEVTFGARPDKPVELTEGRDFTPVNTGWVLPDEADAVVMIEQVFQTDDPDRIYLEQPVFPWQHVRKLGEDVVATELILPAGTEISAYDLGALVAGGVLEVPVRTKPRVAVIPTGSELVTLDRVRTQGLEKGKIAEFNSLILAGMAQRLGAEVDRLDPVPDDYASIKGALESGVAAGYDLVLLNAGSSAGTADYTATALGELGRVLVHGVTIMPGKPTILGMINDTPVIGIPGYPVSAVIAFEQFAGPLINALAGTTPQERPDLEVRPVANLPSKPGQEEFIRVKLGRVGEKVVAVPLHRGAGSITSLTKADGVVRVAANREGAEADAPVKAELLRPRSWIEGTIVAIGSHDLTLDLLSDLLHRADSRLSLSSGHVGSMGGLTALMKGQAHLAGSHLLDPADGVYNISYLKKHLAGVPLKLVRLVTRTQGFMVAAGNPLKITGLDDLTREEVTMINRQHGAGTRILLDHLLKEAGIKAARINGYRNEEFTHMTVAAAVMSGRADVGMGVLAAARALGLDFIPLAEEEYDLVIPTEHFETGKMARLRQVIRSDEFRTTVSDMGGYGLDRSGEVIWEQ